MTLVYDQQCPVCDNYCRMLRIHNSIGGLELVNARENSAALESVSRAGLDVDQGMVLIVDEVTYHGADAIHALALFSTPSGVFNRVNHWVFKSRHRSALLYPLLRACRNLLLKILGRTKINNLRIENNHRF